MACTCIAFGVTWDKDLLSLPKTLRINFPLADQKHAHALVHHNRKSYCSLAHQHYYDHDHHPFPSSFSQNVSNISPFLLRSPTKQLSIVRNKAHQLVEMKRKVDIMGTRDDQCSVLYEWWWEYSRTSQTIIFTFSSKKVRVQNLLPIFLLFPKGNTNHWFMPSGKKAVFRDQKENDWEDGK